MTFFHVVQYVISQLLSKGVVPLLNENDPVSLSQVNLKTFSDNDALASLVSIEMNASLLILLTDVKGVYDRPPDDPEAKVCLFFLRFLKHFKKLIKYLGKY